MSDPFGGRSEALVGFATTSVALLLALGFFPADPSPPGALAIPATILATLFRWLDIEYALGIVWAVTLLTIALGFLRATRADASD